MTTTQRRRIRLYLLVVACATAWALCALIVYRGEWTDFVRFVATLPAGQKVPGLRWAWVSRWIVPTALTYGIVLCGSIFLGLRRLRKGAR